MHCDPGKWPNEQCPLVYRLDYTGSARLTPGTTWGNTLGSQEGNPHVDLVIPHDMAINSLQQYYCYRVSRILRLDGFCLYC